MHYYLNKIIKYVDNNPFIVTHQLSIIRLSPHTGYLEGRIEFIDRSTLLIFEFLLEKEEKVKKDKYRYHYLNAKSELIFRYDNAPHFPDLTTFPHHKHLNQDKVEESKEPNIKKIIEEIEDIVIEKITT